MMFSPKIRYLLVTLAILTASAIQLARGYRLLIVAVGAFTFLVVGNLLVYVSGARERAIRRKQKRDYFAGLVLLASLAGALPVRAQLLPEPAIPAKAKKPARQRVDLEWMWQYGPPPVEGREHELIQDPNFRPFLDHYFLAPQAFWGPEPTDPKSPVHKSLANTIDDFLTIPGKVLADDNRYITVTGAVRRFRTSRGFLFADLNPSKGKAPDSLVVFAAIDWIRDANPIGDPAAQYTLWLFPNQAPGPPTAPTSLPPALLRSLTRWMAEPTPGTGIVQRITAAILVDPDGTPHQIPVPGASVTTPVTPVSTPTTDEAPTLTKRPR